MAKGAKVPVEGKRTVNFNIGKEAEKQFRAACILAEKKPAAVLESLILDFVKKQGKQ